MKRVILGTGPWGLAVMQEEASKGNDLILVNQSGLVREPLSPNVKTVACDIRDAKSLAAILDGADRVYHCAGRPYDHWLSDLPAMMDGVIAAASQTGTDIVYADNLYSYGDAHGTPISEITPELAGFPKAEVRKAIAHTLLDAHFSAKVKAIILRAPDFYGPRAINTAIGLRVFGNLIAGKPVQMLGNPDMPHSFVFIKDAARNTILAADEPSAYGKVWHLPCAQPITQQQVLEIIKGMLSQPISVSYTGRRGLGFAAMFNPELKELKDIMYQFDSPYVTNHSRFSTTFGERVTPHDHALWETLDWFRRSGLAGTRT